MQGQPLVLNFIMLPPYGLFMSSANHISRIPTLAHSFVLLATNFEPQKRFDDLNGSNQTTYNLHPPPIPAHIFMDQKIWNTGSQSGLSSVVAMLIPCCYSFRCHHPTYPLLHSSSALADAHPPHSLYQVKPLKKTSTTLQCGLAKSLFLHLQNTP